MDLPATKYVSERDRSTLWQDAEMWGELACDGSDYKLHRTTKRRVAVAIEPSRVSGEFCFRPGEALPAFCYCRGRCPRHSGSGRDAISGKTNPDADYGGNGAVCLQKFRLSSRSRSGGGAGDTGGVWRFSMSS